MNPREYLPAGTDLHRADFQTLARRRATDLAQVLGSGEKFTTGRRYKGLPVGDPHCYGATSHFLSEVERLALALFDRAVEARDLPKGHNVKPLRKRA